MSRETEVAARYELRRVHHKTARDMSDIMRAAYDAGFDTLGDLIRDNRAAQMIELHDFSLDDAAVYFDSFDRVQVASQRILQRIAAAATPVAAG